MDFWFSYIALAEIYVLLGLSTNLLVGIVGIFSVSQAAVFGVGAYIVAHFLLAAEPMSFLPALGIAAVCCILLNVLVTLPSLARLRRLFRGHLVRHPVAGDGGVHQLDRRHRRRQRPARHPAARPVRPSAGEHRAVDAAVHRGCGAGLPGVLPDHARAVRPPAARDPRGRTRSRRRRQERAARQGFRRRAGRRLRRCRRRAVRDVPQLHRSVIVRSGCVDPAADHGGGRRRAHAAPARSSARSCCWRCRRC